jgi:hypothetical protein
VRWASDALAAGWHSRSLAILAGLDDPPNEFEVDRYARAALGELGAEWPGREELMGLLAFIIARGIVHGTIAAEAGCLELARLSSKGGHQRAELFAFVALDDDLEFARHEAGEHAMEEIREDIRREAQRLLDAAPR